jgi:tetratricopeptide (TPR) repeat protein
LQNNIFRRCCGCSNVADDIAFSEHRQCRQRRNRKTKDNAMPKLTLASALAALSVCLVAVGCAPPVVKVRHTLPAALPLPAGAGRLRVGEITVAQGSTTSVAEAPSGGAAVPITPELAGFMKARLGEALEAKGLIHPHPADARPAVGGGECVIDATIHAAIHEARGKRTVLLLDPATKATMPIEVPTLIRRAEVRVEFALSRAGAGGGLGIAEVVRTYDSAFDPAVRGELGLDRPDDPNRVPPAEPIIGGLLDRCAEAFKSMITPTPLNADLQLRPAGGDTDNCRKAFAAAGEEDWPQAVAEFQKALAAEPLNAALHFNLAVAAEAAGLLDLAVSQYGQALELAGEKDAEAYDGARRCRRVIEARKVPALPAELTRP